MMNDIYIFINAFPLAHISVNQNNDVEKIVQVEMR